MKKLLALIVLLLILFSAMGCGKKDAADTKNKQQEEDKAKEPTEQTIQAFGVVKTKQIKGIMVDLPASIEKVHVQAGEKVKNGDILITLSLKEIEEQINEKSDSLKVAELELQKLMQDIGGTAKGQVDNTPEVMKAKNNLDRSQIEYDKLKKDLESKEILYNEGAVSFKDFNDLRISLEQKQKELENDKISFDDLRSKQQISNNKDSLDVKIKKQNIASLQSNLQTLKDKIAQSGIDGNNIVCHIENGVVEKINIAAGDRLNGEKQIMSILDLDTLIVQANISEDFIKNIKVGSQAVINALADSGREYNGTVSRISNMAVQESGETVVPVEISISGVDEFLLPNFNVNIKIIIPQ